MVGVEGLVRAHVETSAANRWHRCLLVRVLGHVGLVLLVGRWLLRLGLGLNKLLVVGAAALVATVLVGSLLLGSLLVSTRVLVEAIGLARWLLVGSIIVILVVVLLGYLGLLLSRRRLQTPSSGLGSWLLLVGLGCGLRIRHRDKGLARTVEPTRGRLSRGSKRGNEGRSGQAKKSGVGAKTDLGLGSRIHSEASKQI